jgi:3D (Asp-Asp-Asp) domain-containing protein
MPIEEPKAQQEAKFGEFSAYNAEVGQTDSDPFTMASGKKVYDGAIANNCLQFGTKVKVNGKIKVVEDRMNSRYDCNHFDIFMEDHDSAIEFGKKTLTYEIL